MLNSRRKRFEEERQGTISVKQRVRSGDDIIWRDRKPPLLISLIPLLPLLHRMLQPALVLFEESHIIKLAGAEDGVPVTGTNGMVPQCSRNKDKERSSGSGAWRRNF